MGDIAAKVNARQYASGLDTYETIGSDVKVIYKDDLVAIVEGVESLKVSGIFSELGIFTLST